MLLLPFAVPVGAVTVISYSSAAGQAVLPSFFKQALFPDSKMAIRRAGVAQLVELLPSKQVVAGSSPVPRSKPRLSPAEGRALRRRAGLVSAFTLPGEATRALRRALRPPARAPAPACPDLPTSLPAPRSTGGASRCSLAPSL